MADHEKERSGLNWAEAHARLTRLAAATRVADTLSPEEAEALLEARARALARPPAPEPPPHSLLELVLFRSGEHDYALETRFVLEVLRAPALTLLPGAPKPLRGLSLLRGEVLPVVELAPLFGRAASGASGPVLVVGTARPELGLRTDGVERVFTSSRDALLPPPPTLDGEARSLVSGIGREGLIVLEGDVLLEDGRLFFDLSDGRTP